jgi:hypothetical protein
MTVSIAGKYMDENNGLHATWGTLTIDGWARAETSPNLSLYPITNVWHPNHWKFKFDKTAPKDIREFSMDQIVPVAQTNYFANSAQYNEGAVILKNPAGEDIGRGFAEAVSYADTSKNAFDLAGFSDNPKLFKILQQQTASFPRRVMSMVYVLFHTKALKEILQKSAGMKFMGPKPKTPVSRH